MLDSKMLLLFDILAEELHFGRAAARLGIAQSAVSAQLLRLEDQLGIRLLERGRRSVVSLTAAGGVFLEEARAALDQLRRAERIGRLTARGEAGHLSVGYVFSAATCGILSKGLAALGSSLPEMRVTPDPMDTPSQIDAVAGGRLDLGFIRPRKRYPANVAAAIVHREAMLLALSADHRLAADAIDPAALAGQNFIVPQFGEEAGLGDHVRHLAQRAGFDPGPMIDTRDFVTAISMAATGVGVSLVPASFAEVRLPNLRYSKLIGGTGEVELALIWRHGGAGKAAAIICEAAA